MTTNSLMQTRFLLTVLLLLPITVASMEENKTPFFKNASYGLETTQDGKKKYILFKANGEELAKFQPESKNIADYLDPDAEKPQIKKVLYFKEQKTAFCFDNNNWLIDAKKRVVQSFSQYHAERINLISLMSIIEIKIDKQLAKVNEVLPDTQMKYEGPTDLTQATRSHLATLLTHYDISALKKVIEYKLASCDIPCCCGGSVEFNYREFYDPNIVIEINAQNLKKKLQEIKNNNNNTK